MTGAGKSLEHKTECTEGDGGGGMNCNEKEFHTEGEMELKGE